MTFLEGLALVFILAVLWTAGLLSAVALLIKFWHKEERAVQQSVDDVLKRATDVVETSVQPPGAHGSVYAPKHVQDAYSISRRFNLARWQKENPIKLDKDRPQ